MEAKDEKVKEWEEEEEEEQEERGSTPVPAADASSQSPDPRQPRRTTQRIREDFCVAERMQTMLRKCCGLGLLLRLELVSPARDQLGVCMTRPDLSRCQPRWEVTR